MPQIGFLFRVESGEELRKTLALPPHVLLQVAPTGNYRALRLMSYDTRLHPTRYMYMKLKSKYVM